MSGVDFMGRDTIRCDACGERYHFTLVIDEPWLAGSGDICTACARKFAAEIVRLAEMAEEASWEKGE